jgi:two-component system LytT family response regulator
MELKAVIVDDEFKVRDVFINLLRKFCPEITILGEAENVDSAYDLICAKQPNIVFLDIEMPGGNGFELLARFPEVPFEIIFVTSYGHYAIKAIKFSALDYLLKPVMIEDLQQLVARLSRSLESRHHARQYKLLGENLSAAPLDQKLVINTKTKLEYVSLSDIIYLKADGNYTTIFLRDNVRFYIARTLKDYEDLLCKPGNDSFIRIHKGYIVNIAFVRHIERGEDYSLILKDNTRLEISRRKKAELLNKLGSIPGR